MMLTMLLAAAGARGLPGSLRRVLAIGEALPAATIRDFRAATPARLVNLYGPTEAAVSITAVSPTLRTARPMVARSPNTSSPTE